MQRVPVTAVVPLKALARAKSRLRPALPGPDRRALVAAMAGRVVAACGAAGGVDDIVLVAGDEAAAAVGTAAGVRVLVVHRPGLRFALQRADAGLRGRPATLVVPADLPHIVPADVDAVIEAGGGGPAVVVVPTLDGGTGALLRRPPNAIPSAFGPGSAAAHLALARAAGVRAVRLDIPGLAHDVDTPDALRSVDGWPADLAALVHGVIGR